MQPPTQSDTAPPADTAPADWTLGSPGLAYQRCEACSQVWYFRRSFCPACGNASPSSLPSAGLGTVHATTLVTRAPDDRFKARVPYRLVLVDLDEGVRVMAHGESSLQIGDRVRCTFFDVDGRLLPRFVPHAPGSTP